MASSDSIPEPLAGRYKGTFANKVLTHNLPAILDRVINAMQTHLGEIPHRLGIESEEDIELAKQEIIILEQKIVELKQELLDNKPLKEVNANLHDTPLWNDILKREQQKVVNPDEINWLNVKWLYAECYLYRRMREIFVESKYFKNFYPFYSFKEEAFFSSAKFASNLATRLLNVTELLNVKNAQIRDLFYFYVMTSLWGNQCDLSLSCGEQYTEIHCDLCAMQSKILVNNFDQIWNYVQTLSQNKSQQYRIDLILDNASYELFTDLCMVQFFHLSNLFPRDRTKVYFHVKSIPWFVSDTMRKDFNWLLNVIQQRTDFPAQLKEVDQCFKQNIADGVWIIEEEEFWTLPYDYSQLPEHDVELYGKLCKSDLIIFKGDLNYRKLVGDLNWDPTATFKKALRDFQPTTAICSLRTVKADVVVGIEDDATLQKVHSFLNKEWMETGEYAVIHFLNKVDLQNGVIN